eukprot:jgi/Astpho2/1134/Aster-x0985
MLFPAFQGASAARLPDEHAALLETGVASVRGPVSCTSTFAWQQKVVHDEQTGLLFTYVNADDYCRRAEADKCVTTSALESSARMRSIFARRARHCREVLLRQHMYIMADCTARERGRHDEHVLVHIEALPDGSFSMQPGTSTSSEAYRLEDASGYTWEYTVEDASQAVDDTQAEKLGENIAQGRQAKALRGILQRDLLPVPQPAPEALRLLVLADIMTADSFLRDKLFVQYTVSFDPCIWRLAGSNESATPAALSAGALKGATQVGAKRRQRSGSFRACQHRGRVAHFGHPIELELLADAAPPARHWPVLFFQASIVGQPLDGSI